MQTKQQEHEKIPALLFEGVKHSTAIFTREEIDLIFRTLKECEDYPKGEYGSFLKKRDQTILAFLYYCSARPKEILYLTFSDIDFHKRTIFISGKNNKVRKDRTIALPKKVMKYLNDYLLCKKRYWHNKNYVFPSSEGRPLNPETWKTIFREKVLKASGLWEKPVNSTIPKYRSYTLRHTRATQLLEETKDLFAVGSVLGHDDLRSTKTYLHLTEKYREYLRKIMDGEVEVLKQPQVQINQTNNFNILIQQINIMIQQQQKQNEVMSKLIKELIAQNR